MKKICQGCGAVIQTENANLPGYIIAEVLAGLEEFYCQRCYNLIHYNRKLEVAIDESEFLDNLKVLSGQDVFVVNVVDIFDLEGTLIFELNKMFPKNKKIIVGNKFDLFLNSVKYEKVHNYFRRTLVKQGISFSDTLLISSFRKSDIEKLINEIFRLKGKRDVCFIGTTNVGKSSIIKAIIDKLKLKPQNLTISSAVSTTLGLVRIPLPDGSKIIDTPGLVNPFQAIYHLNHEHQQVLVPKKYIKPRVYQLLPEQSLFIGGFCRLDFLSGKSSSFVINVPPSVIIHRTKLALADHFYNLHKDDLLKFPNAAERESLGKMKKYHFFFNQNKQDIYISGLGFITLIGQGEVVFYAFENIKVGIREAIV
ncbi:MAG: ribosome biogenesis GTPase YqeH [Bacilli bacterium]|nr:ribosome biogenesis GTPase YqeH [Bacilli bacterium]